MFDIWQTLVTTNSVKGKSAHDARIVAAMMCHGIANILTFNVADFVRYTAINVYSPADVLAGKIPV